MGGYEKDLKQETKNYTISTIIRDETEENKRPNYLQLRRFRAKVDKQIDRPTNMNINNVISEKNDRHSPLSTQ